MRNSITIFRISLSNNSLVLIVVHGMHAGSFSGNWAIMCRISKQWNEKRLFFGIMKMNRTSSAVVERSENVLIREQFNVVSVAMGPN